MLWSVRTAFACLLWLTAAVPLGLYALHQRSPEAAVRAVLIGGNVVSWALVVGLLGGAAALVAFPPFLPALRLWLRRLRMQLGTDLGPLREAQARLRHLETAADHFVAGRVLLQQGRVREAAMHLDRAVHIDPHHAGSRYYLGLALAKVGQLQEAADQLVAAVQLDRSHAFGAALLELGIVLGRGGADAQAVEILAQHEREFGEHRRAMLHRARALHRLGRRDEALEVLRRAARPAAEGRALTLEDQLARAQARIALLRGGAP
jgi:tetratricopeptide (TPR) repeat protein